MIASGTKGHKSSARSKDEMLMDGGCKYFFLILDCGSEWAKSYSTDFVGISSLFFGFGVLLGTDIRQDQQHLCGFWILIHQTTGSLFDQLELHQISPYLEQLVIEQFRLGHEPPELLVTDYHRRAAERPCPIATSYAQQSSKIQKVESVYQLWV